MVTDAARSYEVPTYKEFIDEVAELLNRRGDGNNDALVASARVLISVVEDLTRRIVYLERPSLLVETTETTDEAEATRLMIEALAAAVVALHELDGDTNPTEQ